MTKGSREAVEVNRQDQKDQNDGQREGRKELVALDPELAGPTGVVKDIALGQNLLAASSSRKRRASSSGLMATPLILTALSCWNRFNERGTVEFRIVAIVLSATSWSCGPVM